MALCVVATGCITGPVGPQLAADPDPVLQLVACSRAAEHLVLTTGTRLDPSCSYTGGIEISSSGVVLDCRGARIQAPPADPWSWGVLVHADASVPLSGIRLRNCVVSGFPTNVMIRRDGAESLDHDHEYDTPFSDIVIEDSQVLDAAKDGIYLEWGVTGVTIRHTEVARSAAVGIYISPGDTDNVVEHDHLHHNGFGDVKPEGLPIDVNGTTFHYLSTGREAIAIDGGYGNVIRQNEIHDDANGAVLIYRNCGEYSTVNRRWWGADANEISENLIAAERNGVWIGSRQAENQYFMECADPAYIDQPLRRVHLDHAVGNVVSHNWFVQVRSGVRVEDDDSRIEGNTFDADQAAYQAVIVGTQTRTQVLDEPVAGTVVRDNRSRIVGATSPFVWAWGRSATTDEANTSNGSASALVEGTPPAIDPFLFVVRVWL